MVVNRPYFVPHATPYSIFKFSTVPPPVVVTFYPPFIKAYYVATRGSFFPTLCLNIGYFSAD